MKCRALGPRESTEREAIIAWNKAGSLQSEINRLKLILEMKDELIKEIKLVYGCILQDKVS